jgi:hypothetical protein
MIYSLQYIFSCSQHTDKKMQRLTKKKKHLLDKANSAPISPKSAKMPKSSEHRNEQPQHARTRASRLTPTFEQNLTKDRRSISRSFPQGKKSNLSSSALTGNNKPKQARTTHHLRAETETRDRSGTPERGIRSPAGGRAVA